MVAWAAIVMLLSRKPVIPRGSLKGQMGRNKGQNHRLNHLEGKLLQPSEKSGYCVEFGRGEIKDLFTKIRKKVKKHWYGRTNLGFEVRPIIES